MTTPQVSVLALNTLALAEENARHGFTYDPAGLAALAASMRALFEKTGRPLVDPLKAYPTADGAAVWDGGRRLAALNLVAVETPDDPLLANVSVILTTQEEARLSSVVTFLREDMHPVQKFLTWEPLFDAGQSPTQIAAAVGASERDVAKILRFKVLAAEVLAAFQAGRMDFEAAVAFTLSDNHERQRAVLESFGKAKAISVYDVRSRIKEGSITATNKKARWIGRKAYEAEGGAFLMDLFSGREVDEIWADAGLVERLFQEKLAKVQADLKAEGWADVIVRDSPYGWSDGYQRITPEGQPAKKGQPKTFTADQMASGAALIVFDHDNVKIERGWAKAKKIANSPLSVPPAKSDPARYGFGHKGHYVMTQVANDATKVALARNPQAAADALLAHLAWTVLRKPQYGNGFGELASRLFPEGRETQRPDHVAAKGLFEINADLLEWKQRLPATMVAFCQAVAALPAAEKLALQALCFASTLDAVEAQIGFGSADRRRNLGWMAGHAGVDIADAWEPDAAFLKGASKDALLAAAKEATGKDGPATAKKGDLVALVEDLAHKGWRPALLREFMEVKDPDPKDLQDAADAMGLGDDDDDADFADEAED